MATLQLIIHTLWLSLSFYCFSGFGLENHSSETTTAPVGNQQHAAALDGAFQLTNALGKDGTTNILLMADGFFSITSFNLTDKKFLGTYGGFYTLKDGKLQGHYEFNTFDSTQVGKPVAGTYAIKKGKARVTFSTGLTGPQTWVKIDEQNTDSPLAGAWRISSRAGQDGQMNAMKPGPRKTIKILYKNRFQWIAFNSETAVFSGTGGGTYTAKDGKYTEHLAFFSRDNNRVGMSLTFNFKVQNGDWHHTGLSSTGSQINEVWTKVSKN